MDFFSKTSDECGLFGPLEIHYCVSDGSRCNRNVCCAGYSGRGCGNADLNFTGCATSINYNLYNSSIMHFTLDHDEMSESVKESVERSGDILFIGVFWKDGYALDMVLQAVDSEGNEMVNSTVRSVTDSDSIFTLGLDKSKE